MSWLYVMFLRYCLLMVKLLVEYGVFSSNTISEVFDIEIVCISFFAVEERFAESDGTVSALRTTNGKTSYIHKVHQTKHLDCQHRHLVSYC